MKLTIQSRSGRELIAGGLDVPAEVPQSPVHLSSVVRLPQRLLYRAPSLIASSPVIVCMDAAGDGRRPVQQLLQGEAQVLSIPAALHAASR